MRKVYVAGDNIFSPIGKTTVSNMDAMKRGLSGIAVHRNDLSEDSFYASLLSPEYKAGDEHVTAFEQIILHSAKAALKDVQFDPADEKTGFILSTTKGNIGLIDTHSGTEISGERISLNRSANIIAKELRIRSEPLVVSHACISGLLAIITGMRLIQSGVYDRILISGGDLITSFIYSGFKSFQAISPNPCRPFDASRDGISLGEAAASLLLTATKTPGAVRISGGAVSNDANHISGPSRTGEELAMAIRSALKQSEVTADEIDFISAHGTATRYNDEMEAKAIHLTGLSGKPVNSLKGYYGHTLGAAGILESVAAIHSMRESILLPTKGFSTAGTEMPVNVIKELQQKEIRKTLKTASGFGGCNAAIVFVQD